MESLEVWGSRLRMRQYLGIFDPGLKGRLRYPTLSHSSSISSNLIGKLLAALLAPVSFFDIGQWSGTPIPVPYLPAYLR